MVPYHYVDSNPNPYPNWSWQKPEERPSFSQICVMIADALEGDLTDWPTGPYTF